MLPDVMGRVTPICLGCDYFIPQIRHRLGKHGMRLARALSVSLALSISRSLSLSLSALVCRIWMWAIRLSEKAPQTLEEAERLRGQAEMISRMVPTGVCRPWQYVGGFQILPDDYCSNELYFESSHRHLLDSASGLVAWSTLNWPTPEITHNLPQGRYA